MTEKKYVLTDEHRAQLKPWADKWIGHAMSTAPITGEDRRACTDAVVRMYAAAGREAPRVVFVPSPFVAAFAAGFAASIWYRREHATDAATRDATRDASRWYVVAGDMPACARALGVGAHGLACAARSWVFRQGGNQWAGWAAFLSFFRHVAGLDLDYSVWDPWEVLTERSGPRYVHEKFCIISDRPEVLTLDDRNRPHNERGPFCRWRDGSALYAWHGTRVPAAWIEHRDTLDPTTALTHPNIEERRAAAEIIGWKRVLEHVAARVVDEDKPDIGTLLVADLPDAPGSKFLRVRCGTGRDFVLPVPAEMTTALQANAWTYGLDGAEYAPEVRT